MPHYRNYFSAAIILGIFGLTIMTGCGATATPVATAAPTYTQPTPPALLNVTLTEWSITLDRATIVSGHVKFHVINAGKVPHDFIMTGANNFKIKSALIAPDTDTNISTDDLPAGTYAIICDVPGHKENGMQTSLMVK